MTKGITVCALAGVILAGNSFAEKPSRSSGHEQLPEWPTNVLQSLQYGVLLEVEGFASKIDGESQSDIVVATVALDVEAAATDWLLGHIGLLWEEDSRETDNVDEAYIALGASETIPYYLVAGRFYQPVGNFESAFISDPSTLELMEMNRTAGMIGFEHTLFNVNAGAFNGDTERGVPAGEGGNTTISDFFASMTLTPADQIQCGAYWLSDLMETYNYGSIGEDIADLPGYETVGAAGAFLNLYIDRFTVNAEYASALDEYRLANGAYLPAAFNLEASVQLVEQVSAGVKFEASDDLYAAYDGALAKFGDKLPGRAYGAVVSYAFHRYATVAAEYLHVEELDDGARGDLVTVQLGLEF